MFLKFGSSSSESSSTFTHSILFFTHPKLMNSSLLWSLQLIKKELLSRGAPPTNRPDPPTDQRAVSCQSWKPTVTEWMYLTAGTTNDTDEETLFNVDRSTCILVPAISLRCIPVISRDINWISSGFADFLLRSRAPGWSVFAIIWHFMNNK